MQLRSTDAVVLYFPADGGPSVWNEACAKEYLATGRNSVVFVTDTSCRRKSEPTPRFSEMAGFLGIEPLFVDLREGKNAIRRILATATGRSFADMKGRMAARSFWETAPTAGFSFLGYLLAIPAVLVSAFLGLGALLSWAVTNEIDSEPDRALAQAICADIDMARTALASAETVGRIAGAALTRAIAEASKTCASSREW